MFDNIGIFGGPKQAYCCVVPIEQKLMFSSSDRSLTTLQELVKLYISIHEKSIET
jgi:hypothetical protein